MLDVAPDSPPLVAESDVWLHIRPSPASTSIITKTVCQE